MRTLGRLLPFILFIIHWIYVDKIREFIGSGWQETLSFALICWMGLHFVAWLAWNTSGSDYN